MTVRVLIVDDEAPARRELTRLLEELPGVAVVGALGVAAEVVPAVERSGCDLVLLDIRMPGESGLEVASRLLDLPEPPHIAFVTAHDEHALAAFDREALDYILKPASPERLERLVERVRARSVRRPDVDALQRVAGPRDPPLMVGTLPGSPRRVLVRVSELRYVEATDELVFLVTPKARLLTARSLADLEAELAPHRFVRTHRSFLVALDHVLEIEPDGEGTYHLKVDAIAARVPVSRRHWPALKRRVEGS